VVLTGSLESMSRDVAEIAWRPLGAQGLGQRVEEKPVSWWRARRPVSKLEKATHLASKSGMKPACSISFPVIHNDVESFPSGTDDERLETDCSIEALADARRLNALIRAFFAERGVLEVETPVLSAGGQHRPEHRELPTRVQRPSAGASGRWLDLAGVSRQAPARRGMGSCYELGRAIPQTARWAGCTTPSSRCWSMVPAGLVAPPVVEDVRGAREGGAAHGRTHGQHP
jgi:hypothetical protein